MSELHHHLTFPLVLFIGFMVTRVATSPCPFTGLSREFARFQARSAYMGVGFTTRESEQIMEHPVRRRIIMVLMYTGNAGLVAAVASFMQVFVAWGEDSMSIASRLLLMAMRAVTAPDYHHEQMGRLRDVARHCVGAEKMDAPRSVGFSRRCFS